MSYTPLPTDQDQELHDAFESDDEAGQTLDVPMPITASRATQPTTPGAYDFERDYDYPPPGSPPGPLAIRNTWGNTNGILPGQPLRTITQNTSTGWFRRIMRPILPTSYQRLPTAESSGRAIGGGMENGGVFSNLAAKPAAPRTTTDANGEVHVMPEETQREAPPTYADAEADAVPGYWGSTVHVPARSDMAMIEDLPAGPVLGFIANLIVSYFFQFVGFLLTYLLHATHAAKYGSRAGFGLTMIAWGYNIRTLVAQRESGTGIDTSLLEDVPHLVPVYGNNITFNGTDYPIPIPAAQIRAHHTAQVWVAFMLMMIGWFLCLSSCAGFYRVKLWESRLHSSLNAAASDAPNEGSQSAIRLAIQQVFGRGDLSSPDAQAMELAPMPPRHRPPPRPRTQAEREADSRLERDLRDAGFL